jgi:serine/threonine protein phosphatase PrpC
MRHATLLGRDHTEIGALASIAEGPAAIALSRGGAAKTYSYVDPNEDAVVFSIGPEAVLLAVADGHDGDHGAAAAICSLRDAWAQHWGGPAGPVSGDEWALAAARAVAVANHAVLAEAAARGLPPAPTTFAFALWRRREGVVHGASVGDSHVFFCGEASTRDLTADVSRERRRGDFLGRGTLTEAGAAEVVHVETTSARPLTALAVASDGLSEQGIGVDDPSAAVQAALDLGLRADPELRPLAVTKAVAAAALGAHRRQAAGDNIACGVVLID